MPRSKRSLPTRKRSTEVLDQDLSASAEDHENEEEDELEEEEEEEEDDQHHGLIPPFVPNQTVFTCHVEQPRSPKRQAQIQQQQSLQPNHSNNATKSKSERFFEAVIRQARHNHQNSDDNWEFKIHFKGWNARYDQWLPASQLLADTEDVRAKYVKQQQKEKSQRQAEEEAKRLEQQRKKQQKKEQQQQKERASLENSGAVLPFTLKTVLVEEREKITRRGYDAPYGYDYDMMQQPTASSFEEDTSSRARGPARCVHALPAAVTIRQLIKHFEKKTRSKWLQQKQQDKKSPTPTSTEEDANVDQDDNDEEAEAEEKKFKLELKQFCKGLGELFETALPVCLLYPQERPQYQYYASKNQSVLDVYGCEFLVRLLQRLPQLMGTSSEPPPKLVGDLTILLQQNRMACFKGKFRSPTYPHEWLGWEKKFYTIGRDPEKKRLGDEVEDG